MYGGTNAHLLFFLDLRQHAEVSLDASWSLTFTVTPTPQPPPPPLRHVAPWLTLYTYSPRKYSYYSSSTFSKKIFRNFFGPFPEPPGAPAPVFDFPFSRYTYSNFSHVSTFFTSFFTGIGPPDDY